MARLRPWRLDIPVGPRSVLFGVHQFLLHPLFVAWGWTKLYGVPRDPRLWVAFVVHDLGYLFMWCQDMDASDDGELHPYTGATIMRCLFGHEWGDFVLYHSRFLAKRHRQSYSRLAVADKLAIALYPAWLYLLLGRASGEIAQYMQTYGTRTIAGQPNRYERRFTAGQEREWLAAVQAYMREWSYHHRDLKPDAWTTRDAAPNVQTDKGVRL